jgi:hypothetical protein
MNTSDTNKPSETDRERVDALTDETIDTSNIPALSDAFFAHATLRVPRQFTTVLCIYAEAHEVYDGK